MWEIVTLQALRNSAPVAQLDRVADFESEGWRFESSRARYKLCFGAFICKLVCKRCSIKTVRLCLPETCYFRAFKVRFSTGAWESPKTLNFSDRSDIVWGRSPSGVAEQGYTMLYG